MQYIKCKFLKNDKPFGRGYAYKCKDDVKVGDMVTDTKGSKLIVTDEPVDMEWAETYGADKVGIVKKYEEKANNYKPENERYIIERVFEHAGYTCVVTFGNTANRCGYVGIPIGHPLYGKGYDDYLEIKKSDIGGREVSGIFPLLCACLDDDERIKIEAYFQCHGGITFADGGKQSTYPIESDLWWFGFDCGHCDDKCDLQLAYEKFPNDREHIRRRIEIESQFDTGGEIRTEEYVVDECKKLAEQLKEFEHAAAWESEEK